MTLNTIQLMLFKELFKVFLLALLTLTGLFLLGGIVHEASQRGLSPVQILTVIPLLIPNMLPYTIPATTLFATTVVYGRLSHDNEYTVVKAAGVNPLMLLKPALLLGLITSGVTMTLYYDLIPRTQRMLRQSIVSDSEDVLYTLLEREKRMRFKDFPFTMFVREVQGRRLNDVIFKRFIDPKKPFLGYNLIARAREARLSIDKKAGVVYVDMDNCQVYGDSQSINGSVRGRRFEFPLPEELSGKDTKMRPMALTWEEIRQAKIDTAEERDRLAMQLAKDRAEFAAMSPADAGWEDRRIHVTQLAYQVEKHLPRQILTLETEMQMRPALAFGCVCFVLVGVPVGIWFSRADYLSSFVSCFLPVICVYYPLVLSGSNLAREGKFPILPAVWVANSVLFLTATSMLWRLLRR